MRTSSVISSKIAAAKRRHGIVSIGTGAGAAALYAGTLVGLGLLLDRAIELPWIVRLTLLFVYATGALAWILILSIRPIVLGPDDEDVALAVERNEPSFSTRLIAAVQFSRMEAVPAGMHEGMIRALILQAEEMAGPISFERIYPTRRMWQLIGGAAAVLLAVAVGVCLSGPLGLILVKRAALMNVPLPHATQVQIIGGDRVVIRGDKVTLAAVAQGVLPDQGVLRVRYASGTTQKFDLLRSSADPSRYELTLDSALEPFSFVVNVNDGWSDQPCNVSVIDRPEIVSLSVKQVFPAYTKLGTVEKQPADLNLLMGSSLLLDIKASSAPTRSPVDGKISHVTLELSSPGSASTQPAAETTMDVPLSVDPANPRRLFLPKALLIPPGTVGMTVHLVDESGMENKDPAVYRISLIDDKAPVLNIRSPSERSETVTRRAFIPIGFAATDDFGIVSLRVHYRVVPNTGDADKPAGGENEVASTVVDVKDTVIDLDLGENPLSIKGVYRLQLAKLHPQPVEGDLIEWWLEAVDGNDATGPGRSLSDVYRARVISEIDKRSELLTRFGDTGDSFSDLADTQQKLNEKLGGEILSHGPETQPAP